MCPACIATMAVVAAKAVAIGGITAVAVKKLRPKSKAARGLINTKIMGALR